MLDLTDDAKAKLASLKTQPGYLVLLRDVMAGLARQANDELLKMDPTKPGLTNEQVVAMQGKTRAVYAFVTQVEDEVNYQVKEFLDAADPDPGPEAELDADEANALPPRGRLPMEIR